MTSLDVLYTDKELSMHVHGEARACDLSVWRKHKDSSSLTADGARAFHRDGFMIGKKLVGQHLIDRAREYIDSQYPAWLRKSRRQDDWRMHLMTRFDDLECLPAEHAPILDLVLQSPQVVETLRGLMGCAPAGIFYSQCGFRTPLALQPQGGQVPLTYTVGAEYHIDGNCNAAGTRFPDPFTVIIGVALVDILTQEKGNFTVFPGAHTARDWSNYPHEKMTKSLPSFQETAHVCLAAGDVVFSHCLLPHRGGKNQLSPEEIAQRHTVPILDENGRNLIRHIPPGTREMVFFRIRGEGIAYDEERNARVLLDPFAEHPEVMRLVS